MFNVLWDSHYSTQLAAPRELSVSFEFENVFPSRSFVWCRHWQRLAAIGNRYILVSRVMYSVNHSGWYVYNWHMLDLSKLQVNIIFKDASQALKLWIKKKTRYPWNVIINIVHWAISFNLRCSFKYFFQDYKDNLFLCNSKFQSMWCPPKYYKRPWMEPLLVGRRGVP